MTDTRTEEWRNWRQAGIGSSDIAAIIGLSPWTSPYALWCEKVGLLEPSDDETDSMEFGRRIEPVLATWFVDRTGLYAYGQQTWCANSERPWMRATVDFFVADSPGVGIEACLGVAETKTTKDSAQEWANELPDYYRAQGQWLMAVTGYDHAWFPTLHFAFGRREFVVHELHRDENDVAFLTKAAEDFWTQHVLTGTPPATDASAATTRALKAAWAGEAGTETDLTEHADLVQIWRGAKEALKLREEELEGFENELRGLLKNATEGIVDGQTVVSWRPQRTRRIDAKALAAEYPDLAAQFTNDTTIRVLRAHKPKNITPKGTR